MAKIYSAPEEIKRPKLDFKDVKGYKEGCKKFKEELKAWCKSHSKGKNIGEVIRIPHADSYAEYMVYSMRPLELINIPLWDEWNSPFADLLTAKKVNEMIVADKKLAELFGG
jgi:hypothetical protein